MRVRKDQAGSNCKSCCISDQNLLCSTARCGLYLSDKFSLWSLLLCIERGLEREEHMNRVQQEPNLGLGNWDRILNGRSPLAVAVVKKVEKILRASSPVSLRGKIPVLPAHTKADQNSGALFLPGTGKDRRPQGGRSAQEGWKPHLLQTGLSSKLQLCINS